MSDPFKLTTVRDIAFRRELEQERNLLSRPAHEFGRPECIYCGCHINGEDLERKVCSTAKCKRRAAREPERFVRPLPEIQPVVPSEEVMADHRCHQPACINVAHLEAVTPEENNRRRRGQPRKTPVRSKSTHCPVGHERSKVGTYKDGRCRLCAVINVYERSGHQPPGSDHVPRRNKKRQRSEVALAGGPVFAGADPLLEGSGHPVSKHHPGGGHP